MVKPGIGYIKLEEFIETTGFRFRRRPEEVG